MKKMHISILLMLIVGECHSQHGLNLGLRYDPHFSWSSDDNSKIKYTNSKGLTLEFEMSTKLGIESGIWFNQFGYRLERTVEEIGVIDGLSTYILSGGVHVYQKFTEKFFELPLQINYRLLDNRGLSLILYTKAGINFYRKSDEQSWYYYQTPSEFSTDNTFIHLGIKKRILRLEFGLALEKVLFKDIVVLGGWNYSQWTQEYKFPRKVGRRQYFNAGVFIGLKYCIKQKNLLKTG